MLNILFFSKYLSLAEVSDPASTHICCRIMPWQKQANFKGKLPFMQMFHGLFGIRSLKVQGKNKRSNPTAN